MDCRLRTGRVPTHDGSIIPDAPNRMRATDATQVYTPLEAWPPCSSPSIGIVGDVVSLHAARPGTRFEVLEPIHQGLREHFDPLAGGVAEGQTLRHDHGPQYMGYAFQQEIRFYLFH